VWLTLSTLYIVFMLVVSRVHYTIDVFGGLFFAGFCFWMVDNYTWVFDQVMNAPYRVVQIVKQKVQKRFDDYKGNSYDVAS
jgi:membrane-associated phospholipid phosphatase